MYVFPCWSLIHRSLKKLLLNACYTRNYTRHWSYVNVTKVMYLFLKLLWNSEGKVKIKQIIVHININCQALRDRYMGLQWIYIKWSDIIQGIWVVLLNDQWADSGKYTQIIFSVLQLASHRPDIFLWFVPEYIIFNIVYRIFYSFYVPTGSF